MEKSTVFYRHNIKRRYAHLVPYVLLLIVSLFSCFILFYDGYPHGDDSYFHFAQIIDKYKVFVEKGYVNVISGNLLGGLGYGEGLFYSPLAHLFIVFVGILLSNFGISLMISFKICLFVIVFLSGLFTYVLIKHITQKNNIAIIGGCLFIVYPYHLFNAFCRCAIAETFAITFLPLFFLGLYDIVHLKKGDFRNNIPGFLEVIIGGGLLYLSHNITAVFTYLAGIVFLIFNVKQVIHNFRINIKYTFYCVASVLALVGIASVSMFSQLELVGTNLYNISVAKIMWTDIASIISRLGEEFNYSGFLNFSFLSGAGQSQGFLLLGVSLLVIGASLTILFDVYLSQIKQLKYFHYLITGTLLFAVISIAARRAEVYFGAAIFFVMYVLLSGLPKIAVKNKNSFFSLVSSPLFLFCLFEILLCLFMMENEFFWKILPSPFLFIQFPWRLWSIVSLCFVIIVCLFLNCLKYSRAKVAVGALLCGFIMAVSMPQIEKRLSAGSYIQNIDESFLDNSASIGWNQEYLPQIFGDSNYKSKYSNSLYAEVKNYIFYHVDEPDYSIDPVFVEGVGTIQISYRYAPYYNLRCEVKKAGIIQMPLLYYPGYEVTVTTKDRTETVSPLNIDGLVAFEVPSGNCTISTKYAGTALKKAANVYFVIAGIAVFTAGFYFYLYRKNEFWESKLEKLAKLSLSTQ